MNLVGFYTELDPNGNFSQGSIYDAISDVPQPEEELLASYLDQGHPLVDFTETTRDVIDGTGVIIGGSSLRSDNTWVWRIDLSHYVRKAHLVLPAEFTSHVQAHGFTVPAPDREQLIMRAQEYFSRH